MRIFSISPSGVTESATLPTQAPDQGYVWIACARTEFETLREEVQATLQALAGAALVDLHISDLLNKQLPSRFASPDRRAPGGAPQAQRSAGATPH